MAEYLLTVKDLAERWQVTERYIRMLLKRGELPYLKIGKLVRIPPDAAEAFVQDKAVESP